MGKVSIGKKKGNGIVDGSRYGKISGLHDECTLRGGESRKGARGEINLDRSEEGCVEKDRTYKR
jgi:hypothetical protein